MRTTEILRSANPVSAVQLIIERDKLLPCSALLLAISLVIPVLHATVAHSSAQPPVLIKMVDMPPTFEPSQVIIKSGESVEWQNVGNEVHHATSDPSLAIKGSDVGNPAGAQPFDSGFLRPGETFTHTFLKPGTYKFSCVVHEAKGMIGQVVVK